VDLGASRSRKGASTFPTHPPSARTSRTMGTRHRAFNARADRAERGSCCEKGGGVSMSTQGAPSVISRRVEALQRAIVSESSEKPPRRSKGQGYTQRAPLPSARDKKFLSQGAKELGANESPLGRKKSTQPETSGSSANTRHL